MAAKEPENCWDFWKCKKEVKDKCPAYWVNAGKECWTVACIPTQGCPMAKGNLKECWKCPWFKKQNHTS